MHCERFVDGEEWSLASAPRKQVRERLRTASRSGKWTYVILESTEKEARAGSTFPVNSMQEAQVKTSRPYVSTIPLRVPVQDAEVLPSVSEHLVRRRRPPLSSTDTRALMTPAELRSRRTALRRSARDTSRRSAGSSRTFRSRNATVLPPQAWINPPLEKTMRLDAAQAPLAATSIPGVPPFSASRNGILIDADVARPDLTSLPTIIEAH